MACSLQECRHPADKYGIPNPCTTCHKDKNTAWAKEAMNRWQPDHSPWRTTSLEGGDHLFCELTWLVFQRNDRAAVAAKSGDFLKISVRPRYGHDRSIAVNGVSTSSEVPATALRVSGHLGGGLSQGLVRS